LIGVNALRDGVFKFRACVAINLASVAGETDTGVDEGFGMMGTHFETRPGELSDALLGTTPASFMTMSSVA
jgi:hypothetical protein